MRDRYNKRLILFSFLTKWKTLKTALVPALHVSMVFRLASQTVLTIKNILSANRSVLSQASSRIPENVLTMLNAPMTVTNNVGHFGKVFLSR